LEREGLTKQLRYSIYKDTAGIFRDHPWGGTGFGTLVVVYPRYASFYDGRVVDHAHNDYLELLADAGMVGGALGLCLIAALYWRGLANLRGTKSAVARAAIAGALSACTGLLLHSFVDFNLHIPSNAMIFFVAGVSGNGLNDGTHRKTHSPRFPTLLVSSLRR